MQSLSDLDLFTLIRCNNKAAFQEIYNRYWRKCFKRCYFTLQDAEIAKDLTQEVFLDIWAKRNHIQIKQTAEGYVSAVAHYKLINYLRAQKRRVKHTTIAANLCNNIVHNPEDQYQGTELKLLLRKAIHLLPPKTKLVYKLVRENNVPIAHAAVLLSLSEQTIKNQLNTACKKIRAFLYGYDVYWK